MIPDIGTHGPFARPTGAVYVPPPSTFREPGAISHISINLNHSALHRRVKGSTAAKEGGLRYEERAQEYLRGLLGGSYFPSPAISFHDGRNRRFAIPDGFYLLGERSSDPELAVIVEIKAQHVPDAWWQLARLYRPLVAAFWPSTRICLLEVCRSFDPTTPFPCDFELVHKDWFRGPGDLFAVMPWK